MASALAEPMEFGPQMEMLSAELLQVLTAGDASRLVELLSSEGQTNGSHVAINVHAAPSCLLDLASNGNTALHLVASRGHAELAALLCERAPSLVATRNRSLDTPLHCAARGGHREVAARLLSTMLPGGEEEAAALMARNRLGETALHEAVRHRCAGVVDLIMVEAPDLASLASSDGVSPLYLAAITESVQMLRLLLRPLSDGRPSPASSAGPRGRTALHVAATISREMVQVILAWEPEGPALLTKADSSGRRPFSFAVRAAKLDVVELLLNVDIRLAQKSYDGVFPLHDAVIAGSTTMIDALIKRCPDYCEMVGNNFGRNLLHLAVLMKRDRVVRYVCQNERFAMLLNARDFEGNTPLHLAVKNGYISIVSILLQSTRVEININNRRGLIARDLCAMAIRHDREYDVMEPVIMVLDYLRWAGARTSLDAMDKNKNDKSATEMLTGMDYTKGTIVSALIASVTFAAAITVPGGLITDDHPQPGTATLQRKPAFIFFVLSDFLAFSHSINATSMLIYSSVNHIPKDLRSAYSRMSYVSVHWATQFMIVTFALALRIMLGVDNGINILLITFVYLISTYGILVVNPCSRIQVHLSGFGKVLWRRSGWRGILHLLSVKTSFRAIVHPLFACALLLFSVVV